MEAFLKSQTAFMQNQRQMLNNHAQAISRLEVQMSQLNIEQPCTGYINECNVVHTLRSGKKVDNQVNQPKSPVQIDPTPASTSAILSQSAPQKSDKDTTTDQVHKPTTPFQVCLGTIRTCTWKRYSKCSIRLN